MKNTQRIVAAVVILGLITLAAWLLGRRTGGPHSVSGTIEADEVHVASRYGGRVIKIFAREGDQLKAGQLIAELEAAELSARRDQIAAVLEELEHGPRPAEIAAAKDTWQSLMAELEFARAEAKRAQDLYDQKVTSSTERDNAISRADVLAKRAAAARSAYELLLEGTRPERLAQARAQLAEVDAQLREMKITAPSDCRLEVLPVRIGDVLAPNREVATVLLTDRLWVRVYVPETWLAALQLGQKVRVHVNGAQGEFEGMIEQINRQAEFTPRNVQTVEDRVRQVFGVKIRLPTDAPALKPGVNVDVFFPAVPAPRR